MGEDDFTLSITSLQMHQADYSRTRWPRLEAPASIHWLAMFWMTNNTCGMVGAALQKHFAVRSFYSSHATAWGGSPLLSSCLHSNEVTTIPTRPVWIHLQLVSRWRQASLGCSTTLAWRRSRRRWCGRWSLGLGRTRSNVRWRPICAEPTCLLSNGASAVRSKGRFWLVMVPMCPIADHILGLGVRCSYCNSVNASFLFIFLSLPFYFYSLRPSTMRFKSDAQIDKRRFKHHIEYKMIISVSASLLHGAGHQCRNMCIYFFCCFACGSQWCLWMLSTARCEERCLISHLWVPTSFLALLNTAEGLMAFTLGAVRLSQANM
jgi:hypothetical protein